MLQNVANDDQDSRGRVRSSEGGERIGEGVVMELETDLDDVERRDAEPRYQA